MTGRLTKPPGREAGRIELALLCLPREHQAGVRPAESTELLTRTMVIIIAGLVWEQNFEYQIGCNPRAKNGSHFVASDARYDTS